MFSKKLVNDAGGVLALLFRRVINNNGLMSVLETLVDKYVDNKYSSTPERTAEKTNYMSTIRNGKMTMNKLQELFKTLFELKYMEFTVETIYNGKTYNSKLVVDLTKTNTDTVYLLFKGLLENGLNKYLKDCIDKNIVSLSEKAKYTTMTKISNEKMSWKTLVELLSSIFKANHIKIICKLEYGNKRRVGIEEVSSIKL